MPAVGSELVALEVREAVADVVVGLARQRHRAQQRTLGIRAHPVAPAVDVVPFEVDAGRVSQLGQPLRRGAATRARIARGRHFGEHRDGARRDAPAAAGTERAGAGESLMRGIEHAFPMTIGAGRRRIHVERGRGGVECDDDALVGVAAPVPG